MSTRDRKHRISRAVAMLMAIVLCLSSVPGISLAETSSTTTTATYTKVTDVSDLSVNDTVIIVAADSDVAMSTNQKSNNREAIEITKSADGSTVTAVSEDSDTYFVQELTLEAGNASDTYALYTGSGYIYAASSSNNYLKTETTLSDNSSWTISISDGTATLLAQGTNTRNWMRYNSSSSLFACYASTSSQGDICIYKLTSKTTGTAAVTVDVPSLSYSQEEKTVAFSCTTSGVTYYYSYDKDGDYTAFTDSTLDVSEHIGETLYAYAELDGSKSETTSIELTAATAAVSGYELITGDITSGDQVMIYYPNGGTVITGTASGSKLTGGAVTIDEGIMETNSVGEVFTVYVDTDGYLSFVTDEDEYLTCGSTGNSLSLATASSDYSLWTLESAGETGSYYIKSVNATYNSNAQYIEYYSGFTTYSKYSTSSIALYTYQFYYVGHTDAEEPSTGDDDDDDDDTGLTSGTYVIWAYAYNMALSSNTVSNSSSYYAGVSVNESASGKVTGYGDTELWNVTVNSDGTLTLEQNGSYMGMNSSNYLTFGEASALSHYTWTVEDAGDGLYYLKDTTSGKYVEWYNSYSDWSTYYSIASGSEGMFALKFSAVSEDDYTVDTSVVEDIAQWGGGGAYADDTTAIYGDKYNVNDQLDTAAVFTTVVSGVEQTAFMTTTPSTGGTTYYMGTTGLGSGTDDYIQLALSAAGWGDMSLSFRMRVTGSGSGKWQLQYSTDGTTFTNFTTGTYECSYTAYSSDGSSSAVTLSGSITDGVADMTKGYHSSTAYYVTFSFDVPEGAENAETLYIRLVPSTTLKANGSSATPGSSSTTRIDSVVISGSPIVADTITSYVTVSPDNSEDQATGTELTLTSEDGAKIYYRFVDTTTGDGEWKTYDETEKPVLESLPATLETYAAVDGKTNSVTRTLTYAAGTVSAVKFTPNGGGVYIEDDAVEVTLSTATDGATIYYAVSTGYDDDGNAVYDTDDNGVIYNEYVLGTDDASPITLEKGFKQVSIMAYAEKDGYTTSAVTTRSFTERSQEEYNLYFGQLHSHTNYSDGAGTITDAYEHATEVHETTDTLDFLAVTDHSNSFDSASSDSVTITDGSASEEWTEGNAYAEQYTTDEFVALFGYEMTWSNGLGHLNTFNTAGFQSRTQSAYTTYSTALQNYYDTLKTVTDSISQFNHPGTTFGDFQDFSYYDEDIDELITLIEVGNGEGTIGSSSYFPSYEYYTRALDKGWHVAPTNNQDNHKGLWGDANTARTVALADSLTEDDIYDAMRNYRIYATEDNDLSIYYTLDGNIMGTILSESDVDDTVTLTVDISDPTDDSIGTVSVIVNGGYVLASQTVSGSEDTVTFEVSSDYSYYYIKVVEADGDIAVTAPVWVGSVEAVGVSSFESDDALAVQDEALNMTLSLYNNESTDFEIDSISVTVTDLDGNVTDITNELVSAGSIPTVIESMGTVDYSFAYTYSGLGTTIYTATVTGTLGGVTKVYTEPLTVSYVSADMVTNVVVDGSHYNDYVTGYYGGNVGELETIAAGMSIRMTIVTDVNDYYGEDSVLDDCALLIISAPAKKSGTANAGDYVASLYEDEFIDAVAEYVEAGGNIIICGLADYGEASSSAEYHTAAQQNKLLAAIGSSMSINDDEAYDVENNGGQAYRLYLETFNTDSEWLDGVVSADEVEDGESYQVYSQYSGCTVNVGSGTWLVKGFETTYSIDSDKDGVGATDVIESGSGYNYNVVISEGEAVFLACEDSGYGGTIFVSGGVFCSDFEVDADVDDYALPYANTTIITNILTAVQVELPVTDIADVREAYGDGEGSGSIYKVRGYVTAGTSNSDNAFFDCIYIQDETGGIDIFPYAESGLELGTYMEVTGYLASYQGDLELKVMSYTILDDENLNVIDPTLVTCDEAADYSTNGGMLLMVEGTVKEGSIYYNSDGTLAQFTVVDDTGEAVVFIDGYILSGTTGENTLAEEIEEGVSVSAVGILYMHPETLATDSDTYGEEVAVLRVRDCDEIIVEAADDDDDDDDDDADDADEEDNEDNDGDDTDDTGSTDNTGDVEDNGDTEEAGDTDDTANTEDAVDNSDTGETSEAEDAGASEEAGAAEDTTTAEEASASEDTSTAEEAGASEDASADGILGDVNEDGNVDYLDAMLILQYDAEVVSLTDRQLSVGDVSYDGAVDYIDAILILRFDAELIESF